MLERANLLREVTTPGGGPRQAGQSVYRVRCVGTRYLLDLQDRKDRWFFHKAFESKTELLAHLQRLLGRRMDFFNDSTNDLHTRTRLG
jgi:hypothetical protein